MTINLNDRSLLVFLQEILENESLKQIFSQSEFWKKGGEQALKLIANFQFTIIPEEVHSAIENLLNDVCPENCAAGCNLDWYQMPSVLLNGDGLCETHHNSFEKLKNE